MQTMQQRRRSQRLAVADVGSSRHRPQAPIALTAKKESRLRIFKSLGAVSVTFEFLPQIEVLKFQGVNKWTYGRGVERIQRKLRLPDRIVLSWYTEFELGAEIICEDFQRGLSVRLL